MASTLTPFHDWIQSQASGTADDEITAALATVTEAVNHLQKKGKVVIELQVEPAGSGSRSVLVGAKVTAKPPEPEPTPSFYFVGDNGSLHRDDPYQRTLDDARDVDVDTGEIRTIDTSEES
jgi:hypothetical protein